MDPLRVVVLTLDLVHLGLQTISLVYHYITAQNFQYRQARFGRIGHVLAFFRLIDTLAIRELHWKINTWTDEEVLAWKASYMASCNAIQVAGAIFASVGLTALQLPNMDATHWSARALLSCSMILGVLSVVFASALQQDIGILNNAVELRLWMSRGQVELSKRPYFAPFSLLPLESSVSAMKRSSLPRILLNSAVLLYTIGFGIYLLYSWLYHVETNGGRNDFRNIFIAFVATVGLVVIYQLCLRAFYVLDAEKRDRDFNVRDSHGFAKPTARKQLEEWLATLADMQKVDVDDEVDYAVLETVITDLKMKWAERRAARESEQKR